MRSRTIRAITGIKQDQAELLLAAILDQLRIITWTRSKKGTKKPESVLALMTGKNKAEKEEVKGFSSAESFEAARQELLRKIEEQTNG